MDDQLFVQFLFGFAFQQGFYTDLYLSPQDAEKLRKHGGQQFAAEEGEMGRLGLIGQIGSIELGFVNVWVKPEFPPGVVRRSRSHLDHMDIKVYEFDSTIAEHGVDESVPTRFERDVEINECDATSERSLNPPTTTSSMLRRTRMGMRMP